MITTTLRRIRATGPCRSGWHRLLKHLGKRDADDEPLPLATLVKSNGLVDAIWCLDAEPQHFALWVGFAAACLKAAQPSVPPSSPGEAVASAAEISCAAEALELYSLGLTTTKELLRDCACLHRIGCRGWKVAVRSAALAACAFADRAADSALYRSWDAAYEHARSLQTAAFLRLVGRPNG